MKYIEVIMGDMKFTDPVAKDWLIGILKEGPVNIKFTKIDGSERLMKCTLKEDMMMPYEPKTGKKKSVNEDILAVYDLDKDSWRSFRLDSIKEVNFVIE